jgi:hypothetical protein
VGHIGHHGVHPTALKEGVQLIFDILRLLPGEARHGVKPAKTLRGRTMTGRAIFEFRFNAPAPSVDTLGSAGLMSGHKKTARAVVSAARKRTAFIFLASRRFLFLPPGICSPAANISADLTSLPLRALGRSATFAVQALLLLGDRILNGHPRGSTERPSRCANRVARQQRLRFARIF